MRHSIKLRLFSLAAAICGPMAAHAATPPSIEDFASRPQVEDVSISPDGRYLAMIRTRDGKGFAFVSDRSAGKDQTQRLVITEPDHFHMRWCRWATNIRLLCSFRGIASDVNVYPVTRLVAVDADGKNLRVLIQNSRVAQGQFQDEIINWTPGKPDTVLIEADEGMNANDLANGVEVYGNVGTHALPAVFELNVISGQMSIRQHARDPIRSWVTDKRGQVRIGWGQSGTSISYWAHLDGESNWRRLGKFELFSRENHFEPIAISADDPNFAYAFGPSEGRRAVWLVDLTDKQEPKLVFSHPLVDVEGPTIGRDGRLVGVQYEDGYPLIYYTDSDIGELMGGVQKLRPGSFSAPLGATLDDRVLLIRSFNDMDADQFLLLDRTAHKVSQVGATYPDRDPASLAPMRSISYAARDGTRIPGYLSVPRGVPAAHLPLIVMPHGGPIARDSWGYFFLREFLVSRGYAVLQMNFRGSSGYGGDWFFAAHQDWGGLTYDDVVDGARWAIQQGITDPQRVCIVGWSFGGYIALLGAQRNPDLFQCAVDIAGVSDLSLLIDEGRQWVNGGESAKKQIGVNADKLKHDSPRLHAEEFKVPLLMLQGKMDYQVPFEQSEVMDKALTRAHAAHRFVVVPEADHQFSGVKDRATLLKETEVFLGEHLPVTPPAPTAQSVTH
jgi:dipeptidyl aminopeptidase/acylaminoacyl peptidase